MPGSWPTSAKEPTQMIKAINGIVSLSLKLNVFERSLSPMNPKLSNNIVIAQPNTGLTKALAKIANKTPNS